MRIFLFVILGLVGFVGIIVAIVMFASSGARTQAKDFIAEIGAGEYDAAHARMHRSLQDEVGENGLAGIFGNNEAYVDVSFTSVSVENSRAELSGTATTASGCVSEVSMVLLSKQIIGFNFTPLCPAP